ncbi:MAG: PQQ-binding-like beta-propeller repeat protein [Rhodopirellula sp.]|nr:PQQ-binding-like beta-propeller repeat protein [Rhodopirellula sp.]
MKTCVLPFLFLTATTPVFAAGTNDWPQFRGPHGDGICGETGLATEWNGDGPHMLWKVEGLGKGYSTVSIADGRLLTMGDRRGPDGQESQFVIALDLETQKELWATRVGPPHNDGPRCTPTIDGPRVYALGTSGDLVCLETASGRLLWCKSLPDDFGGKMMSVWKFSESPLVDGPRLICTPGGPDATMVALGKENGDLIWKCAMPDIGNGGKDGAGYTTVVVADIEGVRQYVTIVGRGAISVEAETGRFLWGYNRIANKVANITSPVVRDNLVFVTTSYKTGSALLRISKQGDEFQVEEVYFLGPKEFENHHGGVVLVGDHIYGGDGQNNGTPVCLELETGKICWKPEAPGPRSAAVIYADGHLIFRYERDGVVALIEANPDSYRLKGTFKTPFGKGPSWAYPVIHAGKLYLRDKDVLMCYDLRAN